jgi:hypothetical protein
MQVSFCGETNGQEENQNVGCSWFHIVETAFFFIFSLIQRKLTELKN